MTCWFLVFPVLLQSIKRPQALNFDLLHHLAQNWSCRETIFSYGILTITNHEYNG